MLKEWRWLSILFKLSLHEWNYAHVGRDEERRQVGGWAWLFDIVLCRNILGKMGEGQSKIEGQCKNTFARFEIIFISFINDLFLQSVGGISSKGARSTNANSSSGDNTPPHPLNKALVSKPRPSSADSDELSAFTDLGQGCDRSNVEQGREARGEEEEVGCDCSFHLTWNWLYPSNVETSERICDDDSKYDSVRNDVLTEGMGPTFQLFPKLWSSVLLAL